MNSITIHNQTINFLQRPEWWAKVAAGQWEPEMFDALDKLVKPGCKFIDIGAWNGIFSLYAGKLGATSYAIEADTTAMKELQENALLNEENIWLCAYAIYNSDAIEKVWAWSEAEFGNSETSLLKLPQCTESREVHTLTIESFCNKMHIDLSSNDILKMDIEGAEYAVIKQSISFLQKTKPKILLAIHPAYLPENGMQEILNLLRPIYHINHMTEHSFILLPR